MAVTSSRAQIAKRLGQSKVMLLRDDLLEADDRVAKSNGSDVRGTWLQLMCCTLPKCLCP